MVLPNFRLRKLAWALISASMILGGAFTFKGARAADAEPQTPPTAPSIDVPPLSKGKAFNPDISANFLGLILRDTGSSNNPGVVPHNGLSLQEAELQFTSDVDPY